MSLRLTRDSCLLTDYQRQSRSLNHVVRLKHDASPHVNRVVLLDTSTLISSSVFPKRVA